MSAFGVCCIYTILVQGVGVQQTVGGAVSMCHEDFKFCLYFNYDININKEMNITYICEFFENICQLILKSMAIYLRFLEKELIIIMFLLIIQIF